VHALESKTYIPLVYRSLIWCGAVGCVSGLRDRARLALSCEVKAGWFMVWICGLYVWFVGYSSPGTVL
jgi:hypothetical protein